LKGRQLGMITEYIGEYLLEAVNRDIMTGGEGRDEKKLLRL
jgi:hypothetical protein